MKAMGLAVLLALACGVAGAGMVAAQPYPTKPIKLILPFGVGSPPDSMGRLVGQCLSGRLGQSVVVENRPGAGSTIATRAAATADPDGYTLLQVNSAFAYAQVLYPNPGYDPGTSFTPVAALASWSLLLVVNAELPVNTVRELVDYAKAHPGKVSIGHTLGSPPQVLAEMFTKASGAAFNSVPYRQPPQLIADLLGGRIHAFFGAGAALTALVEQKKLKALATTATMRSGTLPDVPSVVESGFPTLAFDPTDWTGVLAPAGTPPAVVEILNLAINDCLGAPDIGGGLVHQRAEARILSPAEFAVFIADEVRKWPPRVREAGLKPE
jgi:tripartite-type tricarboxylate transporter receptor subunit TctC